MHYCTKGSFMTSVNYIKGHQVEKDSALQWIGHMSVIFFVKKKDTTIYALIFILHVI